MLAGKGGSVYAQHWAQDKTYLSQINPKRSTENLTPLQAENDAR